MKTPEFNVSDMYENGYCGCPFSTQKPNTPQL